MVIRRGKYNVLSFRLAFLAFVCAGTRLRAEFYITELATAVQVDRVRYFAHDSVQGDM